MADAREGLNFLLRERDRLDGLIAFGEAAQAAGGIEAAIREREQRLVALKAEVAEAEGYARSGQTAVVEADERVSTALAEAQRITRVAQEQADALMAGATAEVQRMQSAAMARAQALRDKAQAEADAMRQQARDDVATVAIEVAAATRQLESVAAEVNKASQQRDAIRGEIAALKARLGG